jgi:hypothetical protein
MDASMPTFIPTLTTDTGASGKNKWKFTWEHGVMLVLGGAALVSGGMLAVQWKHAKVGRKVSSNVVTFLQKYGATLSGDIISGGPVVTQMPVDEAVVGTIEKILSDINNRVEAKKRQPSGASPQEPAMAQQQQVQAQAQGRPGRTPVHGSPVMQSMQPAQQGGEQPTFPEAPISGKSGLPVQQGTEGYTGTMSHDSQGASDAQDYSYQPPIPPGMMPPVSQ